MDQLIWCLWSSSDLWTHWNVFLINDCEWKPNNIVLWSLLLRSEAPLRRVVIKHRLLSLTLIIDYPVLGWGKTAQENKQRFDGMSAFHSAEIKMNTNPTQPTCHVSTREPQNNWVRVSRQVRAVIHFQWHPAVCMTSNGCLPSSLGQPIICSPQSHKGGPMGLWKAGHQ